MKQYTLSQHEQRFLNTITSLKIGWRISFTSMYVWINNRHALTGSGYTGYGHLQIKNDKLLLNDYQLSKLAPLLRNNLSYQYIKNYNGHSYNMALADITTLTVSDIIALASYFVFAK